MTGPEPRDPTKKYVDPETALGGADAVQKTTYAGTAHGTEPVGGEQRQVTASVRSGGAGPWVWGAVILALIALIAYVVGIFR